MDVPSLDCVQNPANVWSDLRCVGRHLHRMVEGCRNRCGGSAGCTDYRDCAQIDDAARLLGGLTGNWSYYCGNSLSHHRVFDLQPYAWPCGSSQSTEGPVCRQFRVLPDDHASVCAAFSGHASGYSVHYSDCRTALFVPLVEALDLSLIWIGIVAVVGAEIGLLTPPLGISCFVIK